jgi:hypothetical protein
MNMSAYKVVMNGETFYLDAEENKEFLLCDTQPKEELEIKEKWEKTKTTS